MRIISNYIDTVSGEHLYICEINKMKSYILQSSADEGKYIRHRVDGPAITCSLGSRWYYRKDQKHRLDGPAFISYGGKIKEYCIEGVVICTDESNYDYVLSCFLDAAKTYRLRAFQ